MAFTRFNSTIKPKIGLCLDCKHGVEQPLTAGRCSYHYSRFRAEENAKKTKKRYAKQLETPLGVSGKQADLVFWFADRIKERSGVCMECLEVIPAAYAFHSCAHLLPKSLFPSVATHPMNYLELGAGCGHHNAWDVSWLSASKMKVAKIAKERFKTFEHLIAPEERRRIPEWLLND